MLRPAIQSLCFLLVLFTCAAPVYGQSIEEQLGLNTTPKNREFYAAQYYDSCLKDHENHDNAVRQVLCTCASIKLSTERDITLLQALSGSAPEDKNAQNTVHETYYLPCTGQAVYTMIMKDCMPAETARQHRKRQKICACMAQHLGSYAAVHAPYIIGSKRANPFGRTFDLDPVHPEAQNPLDVLIFSRHFQQKQTYYTRMCVDKHTIWQENFR